jgi:hypothetical protein
VGGADDGPFGAHFLDAPQQELAEAASHSPKMSITRLMAELLGSCGPR